MVFNKIDAYKFVTKDDDDLSPSTKENLSLSDLENSWIAKNNLPCIFISATQRTNLDEFREMIYAKAKAIHAERYPYNNFLFDNNYVLESE